MKSQDDFSTTPDDLIMVEPPEAGELIHFPVVYDLIFNKIRDAKNYEIATVKTLASSDENRQIIGDFIAFAMNEAAVNQ